MRVKSLLLKSKKTAGLYLKLALIRRYIQFRFFYVSTVKRDFKKNLGYELNLDKPRSFNEKLQWIKVNYRDPIMTKYVDKYSVRTIIKDRFGKEYLNELYGVYDSVNEIDIEKLPKSFVLKPTHSSGRVIICKDKNEEDWKKNFKQMNNWLKKNYYYEGGEWVYKNVKPRIICEKLLDENIIDYKLYCFNGKTIYTQVISNRKEGSYNINNYDLNWNPIERKRSDLEKSKNEISKPVNYKRMIQFSEKIAKDFPFIRMDFYEVDGELYFGEITFFPANGFIQFSSMEEDIKWGSYLELN